MDFRTPCAKLSQMAKSLCEIAELCITLDQALAKGCTAERQVWVDLEASRAKLKAFDDIYIYIYIYYIYIWYNYGSIETY